MQEAKNLYILWTNADPLTSQFMVMMYATNSMLHHYWESVTVIIWGATAQLAAEDPIIQERIKIAQQAGVQFESCVACASELGVREKLEEMGVAVRPWGALLTEILKDNEKLLTI